MYSFKEFLHEEDILTIDILESEGGRLNSEQDEKFTSSIENDIFDIKKSFLSNNLDYFKSYLIKFFEDRNNLLWTIYPSDEKENIIKEIYVQILFQIFYDLNYKIKNTIYIDSPRLIDLTPNVLNKCNTDNFYAISKIRLLDNTSIPFLTLNKKGKNFLKNENKKIAEVFDLDTLQNALDRIKEKNKSYFIKSIGNDYLIKKKTIAQTMQIDNKIIESTTKTVEKYYISYFSFFYIKYLLFIYPYNKKIDEKLLNKDANYKKDFRNVTDFFGKYTDNMHSAKSFIDIFLTNNLEEYYLFIFQLCKQTQFHNIFKLSEIKSLDYYTMEASTFFDKNIKFKTTKFYDTNREEVGITYDENMKYYCTYLSDLIKLDISPSLLKYHATNFIDKNLIIDGLRQVRRFINIIVSEILVCINEENLQNAYLNIYSLLDNEFKNENYREKLNKALDTNDEQYNFLNLLLYIILDFYKND